MGESGEERRRRIGDVVDDYCSHCKLLMNHGIIAVAGDEILKVRCNTCMFEHPYRHGRAPKKKDPVKAAFDELMSRPGMPRPPAPPGRKDGSSDEE
jgi:hypothetical protein